MIHSLKRKCLTPPIKGKVVLVFAKGFIPWVLLYIKQIKWTFINIYWNIEWQCSILPKYVESCRLPVRQMYHRAFKNLQQLNIKFWKISGSKNILFPNIFIYINFQVNVPVRPIFFKTQTRHNIWINLLLRTYEVLFIANNYRHLLTYLPRKLKASGSLQKHC